MRKIYLRTKYLWILFIACACINSANAQNPVLGYSPVLSGLVGPVDAMIAPGDGRLFIVQQ
ncbi:MAG: hypothetical protein EOO13_09995, partial [Chitinophagaceae bacterium]